MKIFLYDHRKTVPTPLAADTKEQREAAYRYIFDQAAGYGVWETSDPLYLENQIAEAERLLGLARTAVDYGLTEVMAHDVDDYVKDLKAAQDEKARHNMILRAEGGSIRDIRTLLFLDTSGYASWQEIDILDLNAES